MHRQWPLACFVLLVGLLPMTLCAQTTILVNDRALAQANTSAYWSLAQERRMGEDMAYALMREPQWTQDPVLDAYVQTLGQQLIQAALRLGLLGPDQYQQAAWRWYLLRDARINAFAIPGGHVGLHLGLIAKSENSAQLASVMAHELAHIFQRHLARASGSETHSGSVLLATALLGAVMIGKNPEAGSALMALGQGAAAQMQLNYSRDMERDADRIGHQLLTAAGFDGHAAVDFFNQLQSAQSLNDNNELPYLRSHPLTRERLADMQARVLFAPTPAYPAQPDAGSAVEPAVASPTMFLAHTTSFSLHSLMAARARVLAASQVGELDQHIHLAQQALQQTMTNAKFAPIAAAQPSRNLSPAQRLPVLYAGSLAASLHGQTRLSLDYLQALRQIWNSWHTTQPPQALTTAQAQAVQDMLGLLHLEIASRGHLTPDSALSAWLQHHAVPRSAHAKPQDLAVWPIAAQWIALAPDAASFKPWQLAALQDLEQDSRASEQHSSPARWAALAALYAQRPQPLQQMEAQAAERAAMYDYAGAVERLQSALQRPEGEPHNEAQLAILSSRLQHYRALKLAREEPQ